MTIEQTAGEPGAEHVAWLRYVDWPNGQTSIRVCDSDDEGAFKVYAHPRPRVGVTEAMKEAGAKQMYEGPESVLGVWRNASEQTKDHYRALAEGCLTAALALAASTRTPTRGSDE